MNAYWPPVPPAASTSAGSLYAGSPLLSVSLLSAAQTRNCCTCVNK